MMNIHHYSNPFPLATRPGERPVLDETCKCGHVRTDHYDSHLAFGHGGCGRANWALLGPRSCRCEKFTWVGEIFEAAEQGT